MKFLKHDRSEENPACCDESCRLFKKCFIHTFGVIRYPASHYKGHQTHQRQRLNQHHRPSGSVSQLK